MFADKENIKSVGFAIITTDERVIEDNFSERVDDGTFEGPELTDADWAKLNEDIILIEGNVLGWLKKNLEGVRDEGHSGLDNALTGTAWYDPDNMEQIDLVMGFSDHTSDSKSIYEDAFYKGVSEFGASLVDVDLEFFDVPDEDYEAWEDSQ